MRETIRFSNRTEFRNWLQAHCLSSAGVWLLFGKSGGPKTVKASEALEEALCFGWIDGQMQSIDEKSYRKISVCAEKTESGREKIKRWFKSWSSRG